MDIKVDRKSIGGAAFIATLAAALLAACGGGGSGSSEGNATAPSGTPPNAFTALQGNYIVACQGGQQNPDATTTVNYSNQFTITVSDLIGADRANVSVRALGYQSPASETAGARCDPAALTDDVTITGQMRDLGKTRTFQGPAGKPVNANLVELTYDGFTLAKGSLGGVTIPLPNATIQIGYLLDDGTLYVSKGLRGGTADSKKLNARFGERR